MDRNWLPGYSQTKKVFNPIITSKAQMPRVEANFAPLEGENCNTALESPLFIAVSPLQYRSDKCSSSAWVGETNLDTQKKLQKPRNKVDL